MHWLLVGIFFVQGVAMFFDEFYYHRRRGLPKWERLGHPIDTVSVLACFSFLLVYPPTQQNIYIFIGLALFSSVLVTKDEFVHTKECDAGENWLHALLFILHPLVFMAAGYIWFNADSGLLPEWLVLSLKIQTGLVISFLFYQIIYWSFICKTKPT